MSRRTLVLIPLALLALAVLPGVAAAAYTPPAKTLYRDAPSGRFLLSGTWSFKLDPKDRGLKDRYYRSISAKGWKPVSVPNAWNVGDPSAASMAGGIGWYRKDFTERECRAGLGGPFRDRQLPRADLAQRQGGRLQRRCLHPVRVPAERHQAPRDQPAGGPRGLAPAPDGLSALGAEHGRRADRRLVQLVRDPA